MEATAKIYRAALYLRLSREDEGAKESASIATQRKMIRAYALENNFIIYGEYIDDGISGTTFERPGFLNMKSDIEAGRVNLVITKDLSRLGRNYITTGNLLEIYFPTMGVRYIAINDGYDSDNAYMDMAPLKNVMNEMVARDTSKKIQSAFETKMEAGEFISSFAPYGYKKDPENKNHLIIDPYAAPIVTEMFDLAAKGHTPGYIAELFNTRGVSTPAVYRCEKRPYLDINNYSQRREWSSAMVCKMLKNIVYMGDMAQGKTKKVSFKSKAIISKPREDWHIVQNTHDAIVDRDTFALVRNRSVSRKNMPINGFVNVFSGIAKCMDCGRNMSSTGTRKKGSPVNLTCGGYKLYGSRECSNHFIGYDVLYDIVLRELRNQINLTKEENLELIKLLEYSCNEEFKRHEESERKNMQKLKLRIRELDKIIGKLYEDNVTGKIDNERLDRMVESYQREGNQIQEKIRAMVKGAEKEKAEHCDSVCMPVADIIDMKELNIPLLHKLIERIEIGQGTYDESRGKHQTVRIYYKFANRQ